MYAACEAYPSNSACFWRNATSSSSMGVFSFIHLELKATFILRRVPGTRHFRVTGKKCGYFVVTLSLPSDFSKEFTKSSGTPASSSLSKSTNDVSSLKFDENCASNWYKLCIMQALRSIDL